MKGRNFLADWRGANHEPMRTLLRTVVDKNLVAVLEITGRNTRDQSVEMEMVLMPLHVEVATASACSAPYAARPALLDRPIAAG